MKVKLLAHTQLSDEAKEIFESYPGGFYNNALDDLNVSDGQVVALAAIRQCYSHKTAAEVLETESNKYFSDKAKEGKRLFNQIVKSGHTSTVEHINFTFAVEGVSRALLAQLTRHRHISFSVQSQRYVKLSSESRSGGFDYVTPKAIEENTNSKFVDVGSDLNPILNANELFNEIIMPTIQEFYDELIKLGVPQEDARAVLPNAACTNLVMTMNLRTALEFYKKRKPGNGAQHEITQLAEAIKEKIVEVEPFTADFFELEATA